MPELISFLKTYVIGAVSLSAICIFLGKSIFKQLLSRDLEKFKGDMQREALAYQADLNKHALEHRIRFSTLHSQVAIVIGECFKRLTIAQEALHNYVKPFTGVGEPDEHARGESAFKAFSEFRTYYIQNSIWLKEEVCELADKLIKENWDTMLRFSMRENLPGSPTDHWHKLWEKFNTDTRELRKQLEKQMKAQLGA